MHSVSTPEPPAAPLPCRADVLRDVYTLRRRVTLGVYAVITFDLPLYFILGYTAMEVAVLAVIGWVIAGGAIWFAFSQIVAQRKRSAYPAAIADAVAELDDSSLAAARSLEVVASLLSPQASFLSLMGASGPQPVVATQSVTTSAAIERLRTYKKQIAAALDNAYPMEVTGAGEDVRIILVPLLAMKKRVGILYLADRHTNRDLGDRLLLSTIGAGIGMALDNLVQRDQLLQKESRLRNLTMGAPVILFAVDNDGILTFLQGKGIEPLGVSPDSVIGRPTTEVFAAYPQVLQAFRRAFAGEDVTSAVTVDVENVRVIYEYRLRPERDERGRVVGLIGVATDITERREAENALHESQRALETLVGNLPGFAYRSLSAEHGTMQYVSAGVDEVAGYTVDEIAGGRPAFRDLIHPDDLPVVRERVETAIEAREHFQLEYRIKTAGGGERWVWEQGQGVYSDDGDVVALEGFISEITERKRAERALAESEARTRMVVNSALDAIISIDDAGKVTGWNPQAEEVFGWKAAETIGRDLKELIIPPRQHQSHTRDMARFMATGEGDWLNKRVEVSALHRDGGEFPVELTVVPLREGGNYSFCAFARDITVRKQAENALRDSEARYRDIFENANDIIFTHDPEGKFGSLNRKAEEIGGYTRDELLGRTVWDVIAPAYHEIAADNARRVLAGETPGPFEVEIIAKDGRQIPMEVSERVLRDEDGEPVLIQGIARDISDRRQAEETIRRLAYYDPLTDLPNRALFEDRLALALTQSRRQGAPGLAVMFLDIDHFKVVNDTLGHNAGDRLLESVARDLLAIVRDGDTVARVGGDEFTLLLPGIDRPEVAMEIADRILECLRQPRITGGQEFLTTGSIGITTYPADGRDAETLLRNADTAMYRAKERGRDNYQLYSPAMNERMLERLSFENDLRHAISRNELMVYYQPIVSVASGEVTGVEALLRWRHPVRGVIQPDDFIPIAEESGLIIEMGEAVLRDACLQLKEWEGDGLNLPRVAVNLSARQLQQEDLVNRITKILLETGVAPHRIQLEITEGAVLKNVDHIIATLHQLRSMGISIALDDFGTGYSSLSYLKRFPIHTVKIDRSFVRDLEYDASDATIVSTVIAMAENMGLTVLAEGVESESQLVFLRERGCDEFQGNLVSEPVPAEALRDLLRARQATVRPPARAV